MSRQEPASLLRTVMSLPAGPSPCAQPHTHTAETPPGSVGHSCYLWSLSPDSLLETSSPVKTEFKSPFFSVILAATLQGGSLRSRFSVPGSQLHALSVTACRRVVPGPVSSGLVGHEDVRRVSWGRTGCERQRGRKVKAGDGDSRDTCVSFRLTKW